MIRPTNITAIKRFLNNFRRNIAVTLGRLFFLFVKAHGCRLWCRHVVNNSAVFVYYGVVFYAGHRALYRPLQSSRILAHSGDKQQKV